MSYTLPPHSTRSPSGSVYYTADQMQAAFAAGAASRDAEVEALLADAESWRKYKARKDAVIAAGMGRNPLRTEAQRRSDAFDSLPDDYEVN